MARSLRILYENAHYHVTCRGNGGQNIFFDDADRRKFLALLDRSVEIYQTGILAFVLMTNHFHLVVRTPLPNLNEFMRHFNISYTSYVNHRYRRPGHLYQGRYKALVIEADSYLVEVSRYVHLNPVRTAECSDLSFDEKNELLRHYQWSSYPAYFSDRQAFRFLSTEEVLGYFGGATGSAIRRYGAFVEEGLSGVLPNPLEKGKGHGVVGGEDFLERMKTVVEISKRDIREVPQARTLTCAKPIPEILAAVESAFGVPREQFCLRRNRSVARLVAMDLLYRRGLMKQPEIGRLMGIDYSGVSVARKRLQGLLREDERLRDLVEQVESQISQ